jgi:hypothetical protein
MVAGTDLMKGISLWVVAMLMPLLTTYIKDAQFRMVIITLVYPNVLALLSRSGRFWISQSVIISASMAAFVTMMLIRLSPGARDALNNPDKNKTLFGLLIAAIMVVFFLAMGLASAAMGMYGPDVDTGSGEY